MNDVPVVFHVREKDGSVSRFIPLSDYEALSDAAVALVERMSALKQVTFPRGEVSVLDLVRGASVSA